MCQKDGEAGAQPHPAGWTQSWKEKVFSFPFCILPSGNSQVPPRFTRSGSGVWVPPPPVPAWSTVNVSHPGGIFSLREDSPPTPVN